VSTPQSRGARYMIGGSSGDDILRLTLTENTVLVDMRTAERRVRMGRERLAMTTRGAESAWAQLLAERRRLELGFSDAFRLLQTEENAVRTQLDAVRARYDVLRAQAQLALALGQFATTGGPRPSRGVRRRTSHHARLRREPDPSRARGTSNSPRP
jgi:hypothetical protein